MIPYARAIGAGLLLAGLGFTHWLAYDYGHGQGDQVLAEMRADLAEANAQATQAARAQEQAKAGTIAAIAAAYERGKQDGQDAVDTLRDDVDAGTLVLRDKFTCAGGVPGPAAGPGSGDGGTPAVLSAADQDFLVRLADEADGIARQLAACQAVIRADRQ